jgi:hypothetical protein
MQIAIAADGSLASPHALGASFSTGVIATNIGHAGPPADRFGTVYAVAPSTRS